LEVVLALSILAISVALLSQVTRQATDNGLRAQRLAIAQLLCESTMAEVIAGAIPLVGTDWTPISDSNIRGNWHYRVETSAAEREGMIGVRLSVTDQPDTTTESPELFYVVRWMIDPNLGLDTLPQTSNATPGAAGSSGSAGGAGSSGGLQ
jgi:type II secretory pathway pseudopilin PulG